MSKNITKETLQQLWRKTKSYTDEKLVAIPDSVGYWTGEKLVLDNVENGMYTVKFISDAGIVLGETELVAGSVRTFRFTLPTSTAFMEIYNNANEKVGRIRTDIPVFTGEGGTAPGGEGKSAYEIWLSQGNSGSETDFLASLKGADGYSPVKGVDYATPQDIALIVEQVLSGLPTAEGVDF